MAKGKKGGGKAGKPSGDKAKGFGKGGGKGKDRGGGKGKGDRGDKGGGKGKGKDKGGKDKGSGKGRKGKDKGGKDKSGGKDRGGKGKDSKLKKVQAADRKPKPKKKKRKTVTGPDGEEQEKLRNSRIDKKKGPDVDLKDLKEKPTCKSGHKMERRTENPKGYTNPACCDVCGAEKLARRMKSFWHCSFCRWDMCPQCAINRVNGKDAGTKTDGKRKRDDAAELDDGDADIGSGKKSSKKAKKAAAKATEEGFNRARRETILPTDETAVNRAPKQVDVVSDWVEGVPL